MTRLALALLCASSLLTSAGRADDLAVEPGEWKVTSKIMMNGSALPPQVKPRCITAEQASDLKATFGPVMGTVNSTCKPAEIETTGRKLKWRLECRGQLDMAVAAEFDFDSPTHYTAKVASKGWMAGSLISDVTTELEGERIGACNP